MSVTVPTNSNGVATLSGMTVSGTRVGGFNVVATVVGRTDQVSFSEVARDAESRYQW